MSDRPLSTLPIPHTTLSKLLRAGYHSTRDLDAHSAAQLAADLQIPLADAQTLFGCLSASQATQQPSFGVPVSQIVPRSSFAPWQSQPAASLHSNAGAIATGYAPVDRLLGGGLLCGHVLELSGPPGCAKERVALGAVKSVVERGECVLLVDCQNMLVSAATGAGFVEEHKELIRCARAHTLEDVLAFMHTLSAELDEHPNTTLLVLGSLSFPFQSTNALPATTRNSIFDRVKQSLAKACAGRNLSVIVTSQLATKLVNEDGSAANFDTGSKAVMLPALPNTYLPSGRSYRLMFIADSRESGRVRMLSSPTSVPGQPYREEPYGAER